MVQLSLGTRHICSSKCPIEHGNRSASSLKGRDSSASEGQVANGVKVITHLWPLTRLGMNGTIPILVPHTMAGREVTSTVTGRQIRNVIISANSKPLETYLDTEQIWHFGGSMTWSSSSSMSLQPGVGLGLLYNTPPSLSIPCSVPPFVYSHLSQVRGHVIQPSHFWSSSSSRCIQLSVHLFLELWCLTFFLCDQAIVFFGIL